MCFIYRDCLGLWWLLVEARASDSGQCTEHVNLNSRGLGYTLLSHNTEFCSYEVWLQDLNPAGFMGSNWKVLSFEEEMNHPLAESSTYMRKTMSLLFGSRLIS